MTGLPTELLEVGRSARVGGQYSQNSGTRQGGKCLFGPQDGQGAIKSANIEFDIVLHAIFAYVIRWDARGAAWV